MVEQQNQPNKHVDDLIDAYALGILEDEAIAEVERHLEGCPACRQALQRAREVVELLAFAPRQAPPPARLKQRILSRIAQESQSSIPLPGAAPIRQGMIESLRQWFIGQRSEPPPLTPGPG